MGLADVYRKRFLAGKGFYSGASTTFDMPDAWKMALQGAGFYSGSDEQLPAELDTTPQTTSEYLAGKEMNKQQQSGNNLGTKPLTWKLGRRKNRYSKYL